MRTETRQKARPTRMGLTVVGMIVFAIISPQDGLAKDQQRGRLQLEVYGGISLQNPGDLNMIVDHDNTLQNLLYDAYYDHLMNTSQIVSWSKEGGGELKKIKHGFPLGARIRYGLNHAIDLSLGIKYFFNQQDQSFSEDYIHTDAWGVTYVNERRISSYALSVKGLVPMVGIHFRKALGSTLGVEGYVSGGPLIGQCRHYVNRSERWVIQWNRDNHTELPEHGRILELEGRGTGISVEAGGRLDFILSPRCGVFVEAGYALQTVRKISGSGKETILAPGTGTGGHQNQWEGEWGIIEETILTDWGSSTLSCPTNFWENGRSDQRIGDFELNLSGMQLKAGFYYRF